jgi:spatacsin
MFVDYVTGKFLLTTGDPLPIGDYGPAFATFCSFCESAIAFGQQLLERAKQMKGDVSVQVSVNLVLHASLSMFAYHECAELLNELLDEQQVELMSLVLEVFPRPALLPRFVDVLSQRRVSPALGRIILNCARQQPGFDPNQWLGFAIDNSLIREQGELELLYGLRLLGRGELDSASRHYLLALSFFLHEKCYSLAMECLTKLSLIGLQLETDRPVLQLSRQEAMEIICEREFKVALSIAVAYGLDDDQHWAEAIYEQVVRKGSDAFLDEFLLFRPLSANLCGKLVTFFLDGKRDTALVERMKKVLFAIPNLVERYRLAQRLQFTDFVNQMRERNPLACEWSDLALEPAPA